MGYLVAPLILSSDVEVAFVEKIKLCFAPDLLVDR